MNPSNTLLFPDTVPSQALLEKYNTRGPRYTSYPTAPMWTDDFGSAQYDQALVQTNAGPTHTLPDLSLYVHIPFCQERCLFCGCNVVITRQTRQAEQYLNQLFREIDRVARTVNSSRRVVQFHWGGGTPTYLSTEQMERLFAFMTERFTLAPDAEVAIEVDPRKTTLEQVHLLYELGFNRISMGVQDFNPVVQESVNRIQPVEMTAAMVDECRKLGFESLNFDLIYGLPHQTVETFSRTLDDVIQIGPDRIALYNFAYVPWISPHQKRIPEDALPGGDTKFRIFRMAMQRLTEAGYVYIGLDHFAKPEDELSRALHEGRLHRNFMGYTVQKGQKTTSGRYDTDLYGFGVSAIGSFGRYYAQNHKKLSTYYEALDDDRHPTHRGYVLSDEDLLRRQVILSILCQGTLRFAGIEQSFGVDVKTHFAHALAQLEEPTRDGMLNWDDGGFTLTPLGRIFSRNIAMVFDAYLSQDSANGKPLYSKTL